MALAAILASIDGINEAIRGEYRPASDAEVSTNPALKGKFLLDVTPAEGFRLGNVDGLNSAVQKLTNAKTSLETKLSKFGELDPDDVTSKLTTLSELQAIDPAKEADKIAAQKVKAATDQLQSQFDAERKDLTGKAQKYQGALDGVMRRGEAIRAITEHGGSTEALLPHVLGQTKFTETEDGKFKVDVVDADGNPRIGDTAGNPMSLDQLVEEFKSKDAFAPLFAASGQTGGGARTGSGGGGGAPSNKKKSEMSLNDRADFIGKHGSDAYLNLPA